jgi:NDP-sugar pyrophosphorylase family protein
MNRLFIFGSGAHARKAYHCATSRGHSVTSFVDEMTSVATPVPGIPIFNFKDLPEPLTDDAIFVAIGNRDVRLRLMDELQLHHWRLPALIHASACVAPDVTIGDGVLIAAGAIVENAAVIGRGAIIDIGVLIDHDCRIGPFCHLRPGLALMPRTNLSIQNEIVA